MLRSSPGRSGKLVARGNDLGVSLPTLVGRRIRLRRSGAWWIGLCPFHDDRNASFGLTDRSGRWRYRCFACGACGDTADWLQRVEGVSRAEALASLGVARRHLPQPKSPAAPAAPESDAGAEANLILARALWCDAVDAAGTLAEVYLHRRRLRLPAGAPLRFHPRCPRGRERLPALVTLMTDPMMGAACGIHRTFLDAATGGKASGQAKMMLGRAGVIRLQPDEDMVGGLGLTEGIETGLALIQHAGWRPVWASASAGGMRTLPVLPGIETLTLFPDRDDKGVGIAAAEACAARWRAEYREARLLLPHDGQDWHDALTGGTAP